jgi:hypothetical protein
MTLLTPQQAMIKASELVGSDDFGPDGFREGLERTLEAFARVPMTDQARRGAENKIVNDLAIRCRIEAWYLLHPEIEDLEIDGPVLVCGLPRTGTTATVGMMALDLRFRFLRTWEALDPTPPPIAEQEDIDPRVVAARKAAQFYDKPTMHIHDPDGPEEDIALLSPLNMHGFHGPFPMPDDFVRWWITADFTSTYAYHRRVMKLLQSRRPPGLWLLKAPAHLFKLDAFNTAFPNARYVMTHRDPAKVIPSVASLQYTMQAARTEPGSINKGERGRHFLSLWREGMELGLAARQRIGEDRFIDVTNDEIIRDPLSVFERIYNHIGLPIGDEFAGQLSEYKVRNAPGARGEHRYTAEEYGLSHQAIRQAFSGYIQRFGLAHQP